MKRIKDLICREKKNHILNVCTFTPLALALAVLSTDTFHLKTNEEQNREGGKTDLCSATDSARTSASDNRGL